MKDPKAPKKILKSQVTGKLVSYAEKELQHAQG